MHTKIILISLLCSLRCIQIQSALNLSHWFEVKPSYFRFTANPMKTIYHQGGFEVQGSITVPLYQHTNLYSSIGYRQAWGHALNTYEKTKLAVVPIDLGLKPVFQLSERCYYFLAIGPRFFFLHQTNQSPYIDPIINSKGVGLFVNTGFNTQLTTHLLLGLFGEYSYEKKIICPHKPNVFSTGQTQIGGFALGINIGYAF